MDIKAIHNSHDMYYRKPFGAVLCGTNVSLGLDVFTDFENVTVKVSIIKNEEKRCCEMNKIKKKYGYYFCYDFITSEKPGLIWYYFEINLGDKNLFYGNNLKKLGGEGIITHSNPLSFQITNHKQINVPSWFKESIMYQIFVDRFYCDDKLDFKNYKKGSLIHTDWNDTPYYIKDEKGRVVRWDFFGGNLKGIIKKLDYLNELGVGTIYLNPIFDASSNHKYDTADYKKIDPAFGDENILKILIDKAAKYNISIILDGVFSHTGSDSKYFNKYSSYDTIGAYQSKKSPYYSWYRFSNYPDEYEAWWGIDTLPNVDELEPTYLDYIIKNSNSVLKHWMEKGVKGWRLDVADELPDIFIKELRKKCKKINKESVIIGEVWEDASNKISYNKQREYLYGDELDSVMNYPFKQVFISFVGGKINGEEARQILCSLYENYPREIFYSLMNLIGTHDTERIITVLNYENDLEIAIKRLKLLSLIQFTFPGVPCIYYGDEAGLEGGVDPDNRRTFPWGKENKELLQWYKKICNIRNRYNSFKKGSWFTYNCKGNIFGYIRKWEREEFICLFNAGLDNSEEVILDEGNYFDIIENKLFYSKGKVILNPLEGKIIQTMKN